VDLTLLLLALLAFRRGWLLLLPLVLLPMLPGTAHAASWRDLWQRRDQQAAAALGHGDAKQAMQLARDPAWRGAAAYRAGDYAAASQALREAKGGDAAYNLGNALARGGKYQDAIRAYDRALQIDPANADAKANRQAVEDWLRKQPPQDPSQQKPGQNGQDGKPQGDQGQNGQDKNGQGKDGQNQNGQNKNGQDQGGQDRNDSQSGQSPQDQSRHDPQQSSGKDGAQQDQPQPTPEQQAEQQAQAAKAQQALKQQLDQALGAPGKPATKPPTSHELGAAGADDPQSKLPADLRQALQRVPDDPGALLRRKFELEYQRRHGGTPDEDGP